MSRYEILHEDYGLAFGEDHAVGEFLMIWCRPQDPDKRKAQDTFGVDPYEVLVDRDTMFDKTFNNDELLKELDKYGFDISELQAVYNKHEAGLF